MLFWLMASVNEMYGPPSDFIQMGWGKPKRREGVRGDPKQTFQWEEQRTLGNDQTWANKDLNLPATAAERK